MKSYSNLYYKMLEQDAIKRAVKGAAKGKRSRKRVSKYLEDIDKTTEQAFYWIYEYKATYHKPIKIYDGISRKIRTIIVPSFPELVVQHSVINVLMPIFKKGMYEHTYASIPGRGAHKAKKYIEKWISSDPKNVKYCLKMDIKHFFESVPHDILKKKFAKKIRDKQMLNLIYEIIDTGNEGLPLGFYTSQWFANWYLQELDHYIKEELQAVYYVRYMDDMVIFGPNKRKLHRIREEIEKYLNNNLGLRLKENWQVFKFCYTDKTGKHIGRDLDFMGFRFFRDKTILRKSIMIKASRKARRIEKKEKPTVYEIRQAIAYMGWISATDTYNYYLKYIKPGVNFKEFKKRISRYQKRLNREKKKNAMVKT